ncbi:MAG TPA: YebC/PmpR family DNA-binding transcriptional regulator [Acidimicrobiia bacterium]|jgi:YebC/PmpR family DNA-binding regulatory protein|nr:YebC/PmpR family DNA-binding transcriptional regulator [Acidimicrobiia bacterium]
MSGHSKWHSIKHKKGAADAARGKLFAVLIRQIEVAARSGGGDPESNATLRTMVQKARDASVPVDTIARAIKRGTGEEEGVVYEPVNYEGYAPHGVAVFVQALTDNRNRTGAEIKNIFSRNGGNFAEPGAVAWQFERRGEVMVEKSAAGEDDLMLVAADAGADDIVDLGDLWQVTTPPTELHAVRTAIEAASIKVKESDLTMVPTSTVELGEESAAKSVLRLVDALEEHDDVEAVYANFDIPESVLDAVTA